MQNFLDMFEFLFCLFFQFAILLPLPSTNLGFVQFNKMETQLRTKDVPGGKPEDQEHQPDTLLPSYLTDSLSMCA